MSRSHSWKENGLGLTTAWMIPKPVFFQETSPFAQPHPCSLQEKSRPDRQCRACTSRRLPCPACLPVPALPQISTTPARPSWWARTGGSLMLARPDQAGPFHPRTPDLHGAPRTHTVKPLYPRTWEPQRTGTSCSWASQEKALLNHPCLVRTRPPPHICKVGRPRAPPGPAAPSKGRRVSRPHP